jgi:sugar phosphate isomerase/epimerase
MARNGRRTFIKTGILGGAALGAIDLAGRLGVGGGGTSVLRASETGPGFKLGLVTYNLAKDWDIETIIKNCEETGFDAADLRTTHKHGVEITISKEKRAEVRKRFENSRVRLVGLGATCAYHYKDPAELEKSIEETKQWCELAKDLGCLGVRVRPNQFVEGVPHEKTLEQIGRACARCGDTARDNGVELWLEVHGSGTAIPTNFYRIMQAANNHPAVGLTWNSNDTDLMNGGIVEPFNLLKPWLRNVHMTELWRKQYPYHVLFGLLKGVGYNRYTFAEIPESCEPIRLMRYYRALWEQLAA